MSAPLKLLASFDVFFITITGGIGSGKSSVSGLLVERGAVLVDADAIVRELQRPGEPVFVAMVERWGDAIITLDGELDRQAVADRVFRDRQELEALNSLVHPPLRAEMARRIDELASTDQVVLQDIPLLAEWGRERAGPSSIVVVDCPTDIAISRLVAHRGFSPADAQARVEAQASRQQRLALADFVVDNSGSVDQLKTEVDRCWEWIQTLEPTPWPPSG